MAMSILVLAAALQAAQPAQGPPGVLDLLEEEWVCREEWLAGGPLWRTETWRTDEEGRLIGTIETSQTAAGPPVRRQEAEMVMRGRGRGFRVNYRPGGGPTG